MHWLFWMTRSCGIWPRSCGVCSRSCGFWPRSCGVGPRRKGGRFSFSTLEKICNLVLIVLKTPPKKCFLIVFSFNSISRNNKDNLIILLYYCSVFNIEKLFINFLKICKKFIILHFLIVFFWQIKSIYLGWGAALCVITKKEYAEPTCLIWNTSYLNCETGLERSIWNAGLD